MQSSVVEAGGGVQWKAVRETLVGMGDDTDWFNLCYAQNPPFHLQMVQVG